jgi:hypothetical protein
MNTKQYEKDYGATLACIPLKMAQHLVSEGFVDDVDILKLGSQHIFRDELLYLMDIPREDLTKAAATIDYTFKGYPALYVDMSEKKALGHFKHIVHSVLQARKQVGI